MATSGNLHRPYESSPQPGQQTPLRVQALWTSSTGLVTMGALPIFSSATASLDFYLTSINVDVTDVTAASLVTIQAVTTTVSAIPTASAGHFPMSFPAPGVLCGTTTTATVSVVVTGGTSTIAFIATGNRKI